MEVLHEIVPLTVEAARQHLEAVCGHAHPTRRWLDLGQLLQVPPEQASAYADAAFAMAEDPSNTQPSLLKASLLDVGMKALRRSAQDPANTTHRAMYKQFRELLPKHKTLHYDRQHLISDVDDESSELRHRVRYETLRTVYSDMATEMELNPEVLYGSSDDYPDRCMPMKDVPSVASHVMAELTDRAGSTMLNLPPALNLDIAKQVIMLFPAMLRGEKKWEDLQVLPIVELARYSGVSGFEHDGPVKYLYENQAAGAEYIEAFNALFSSAEGLREAFPGDLGDQAVLGARQLIGNALFTVVDHLKSGRKTDTSVALRGGREIPVKLDGDEPLQLLEQLDQAFRKLRNAVAGPSMRSVEVARGEHFTQHRFIDIESGMPPSVMLYVRDEGGYTYDPAREYGRPGKGVEASMSYTVQLDDNRLLPLDKKHQGLDCISIRLDREASDDPRSPHGVISLDIGSILGSAGSLGGKIAYLLGQGNTVFSKLKGIEAGLNHSKNTLDQRFGQAEWFAIAALQLREQVLMTGASKQELKAYKSAATRWRLGAAALAK